MPRLNGTEEWNEDSLQEKVRYYLGTMISVGELARIFTPPERVQTVDGKNESHLYQYVIDVRLEQFTEAVALLLVSNHTEEVLPLLSDPGLVLNGHPTPENQGFGRVAVNIRQFVGLSLFATLVRLGGMHMGKEGLEYATTHGSLVLARGLHSERELLAVLPTLFSIAVAGELDGSVLSYLSNHFLDLLEQYGALGVLNRPEAQLLGVYRTFFESDSVGREASMFGQLDGFIALRELERRYTNRIREMRIDRYHWVRMNAPGDLIDWVLLIAQVAMLRRERLPFLPEEFAVAPETRFCWDLARAFA